MDKKQHIIKAIPQADRLIRFIISDSTTDHAGDILVPEGCSFDVFKKNPQFLGFHDANDFPMGKPRSWGIDTRAGNVWMEVYFPKLEELATSPELASEKAKQVDTIYNMYKLGMLNAVSVGFKTIDYEPIPNSFGRKILKWTLLEVSAVPIPCNENALVEARGIKSFDKSIMDELEKTMEVKANKKVSKESADYLKELHERMTKACKELSGCHKELAEFFAEPVAEPEKPEEKPEPKSFDLDKVAKILNEKK
jgi:hypothetical protein